jgi:hypothetical protein
MVVSGGVFARGGAGWPVYGSLNYQDAYYILKGKYGDVELLTSFDVNKLVYLCMNGT